MLWLVLLPFSFSSRFMRVTAAARPIDTAKIGSRLLFGKSVLLRELGKRRNELGYNVLVRHGCMEKFISSKHLGVVNEDGVGLGQTTVIIFWVAIQVQNKYGCVHSMQELSKSR
jgi:hypothetical protein